MKRKTINNQSDVVERIKEKKYIINSNINWDETSLRTGNVENQIFWNHLGVQPSWAPVQSILVNFAPSNAGLNWKNSIEIIGEWKDTRFILIIAHLSFFVPFVAIIYIFPLCSCLVKHIQNTLATLRFNCWRIWAIVGRFELLEGGDGGMHQSMKAWNMLNCYVSYSLKWQSDVVASIKINKLLMFMLRLLEQYQQHYGRAPYSHSTRLSLRALLGI